MDDIVSVSVCVYTHLILHHGPLLCRPAVVWVMGHCGGAAKVTQLDGALVTNQEVLNLHKGSDDSHVSRIWAPIYAQFCP